MQSASFLLILGSALCLRRTPELLGTVLALFTYIIQELPLAVTSRPVYHYPMH
jgi:hypothetical protein